MGAQYQGRCYASADDAASALWSGAGPVVGPGSPPVVSVVEWGGASWQVASYQGGTLLQVVPVPSVAFASCDVADSALDGMALGWVVAGVWAAAWAVHVLRTTLGWR